MVLHTRGHSHETCLYFYDILEKKSYTYYAMVLGGMEMENIIIISGKVQYTITLDPSVWIFDDR
ncbi:MAG: hypothetical protein ACJ8MO_03965, partial [Bacillus sp. (in: firmicutes)]